MTLLELLVVLVILGIGAGVAVVARVPVDAAHKADLTHVVTTVRRLAIARGEPLRLSVHGDGHWLVRSLAGDTVRLGPEALPARGSAVELLLDALGTCRPPAASVEGQTASVDPLTCRVREAAP